MGNTPLDRSPEPSDGADLPESPPGRDPSSPTSGTDGPFRSVVSAVGRRVRQIVTSYFARESTRESTPERSRDGETQDDTPARSAVRGADESVGLPRRPGSADDHPVDRHAKTLAVTDDLQRDPPEHPNTARLDVHRHGERLSLSRPGEPEEYISSTEWVSFER